MAMSTNPWILPGNILVTKHQIFIFNEFMQGFSGRRRAWFYDPHRNIIKSRMFRWSKKDLSACCAERIALWKFHVLFFTNWWHEIQAQLRHCISTSHKYMYYVQKEKGNRVSSAIIITCQDSKGKNSNILNCLNNLRWIAWCRKINERMQFLSK